MQSFRAVLALFALAVVLPAHTASADDYPNRPVHLVFPYSAGGVSDLARLVAERLGERWRQPVLVEVRPGASGNVGAEFVARAPADGYTLLIAPPPPLAINQSLFARLGYDPAAFVPVTVVASMPNLLVATRALPASNLRELLDYAKANPDRLSYASTGNGGTPHLSAELLKAQGQVRIVHVPYQGIASALPDLVAGRVDLMFANLAGVMPLVKDGRLKVLAVASAERLAQLPERANRARDAARICLRQLAGARRAGADTARGGREDCARGAGGSANARGGRTSAPARRRSGGQHAGTSARVHSPRSPALGAGDPQRSDQARLRRTPSCSTPAPPCRPAASPVSPMSTRRPTREPTSRSSTLSSAAWRR